MREERTLYQKIMLVILATMIVVFGIVTAFNQSLKGILLEDAFLRKEETTDADCFTGKVNGESVTLIRWYGSENGVHTVTLRVGKRLHDTYTVYLGAPMIPLSGTVSTLVSAWQEVPTLRIAKNDTVIFEGGYQESSGFFYTPAGEWTSEGLDMTTYVSGADLWEDYTVSKGFLARLVLKPELVDRGDWRLYALMVCCTLLVMVDVAFPYTIFRWRYRRWVKDPEPTDNYLSMQRIGWGICLILLLSGYVWAATTLAAV